MSKENPKALTVMRDLDKSAEQAAAEAALDSAVNAATVVDTYQGNILGGDLDLDSLVATLKASMNRSACGELAGLEAMLIGQATALQTIFVSLAKRAHHQKYQQHLEAFLGLALKAQAQSRATIQAVVDLKFPRQATFVKQANIANGPQQVNNPPCVSGDTARALEKKSWQNELLMGDTRVESTHVDARAQAKTARGDSAVEALGKIERSKKRGR